MINKLIEERINGAGPVLRLVTPLMCIIISVLVTIMLFIITGIKTDVTKMDLHFTNHLKHHQDLEIGYERRLTRLETIHKIRKEAD